MYNSLRQLRIVYYLLVFPLLLSGCATRKVALTSDVKNTEVSIGDKRCITPCTMKASKEEIVARFKTPDNREQSVKLSNPPSNWESTKSSMCHFTGGALEILSYPFIAIGLVGLASLSTMTDDDDDLEDKDYVNNEDSSDDSDLPEQVLLYTAGSLLAAYSFMSMGEYFKGKVLKPEVVEGAFEVERVETIK